MVFTFDPSKYIILPRTTGTRYLTVSRLLRQYAPAPPRSEDLERALGYLESTETTVTDAYVARHREYGPSIAAQDSELDVVVDALLYIVRDRIEHWQVFERPGVRRLIAAQKPGGFDFEACAQRAQRARAIGELLLARGLDFTKRPYVDQAEAMRTLDEIVTREQLGEDLEQLVGVEHIGALRAAQAEYYDMVAARTLRARGSTVNLSELNARLKLAIERYLIAVLASIRDDDPDSVEQVQAALRPVDALRELLARERSGGTAGSVNDDGTGDGVEVGVDPAVDELLGEQRTLEGEVGLSPEPAAETEI
jgi:hypothetical protein